MGQLHELLAVEGELKSVAERAMSKARALFTSAQMTGSRRIYAPLLEGGDTFPDEEQLVGTTVERELGYLVDAFGAWLDASMQKEMTNRDAGSELCVGDVVYSLSATALLNLESKLADLRKLIDAIPTNDPARRWTWNEDMDPPCYESDPLVTFRTQKEMVHEVMYEATREHPAQIHTHSRDVRVGEYETVTYSGAISVSDKRDMLRRIEKLQRDVRAARMKANQADIYDIKIADRLLSYILRG